MISVEWRSRNSNDREMLVLFERACFSFELPVDMTSSQSLDGTSIASLQESSMAQLSASLSSNMNEYGDAGVQLSPKEVLLSM